MLTSSKHLLSNLREDVSCGIGLSDTDVSQNLFYEAYELLFNLINIKEFQTTFCPASKINQNFLKALVQFFDGPEAELIFGDKLKNKAMALKEVVKNFGQKG